MTKIKYTIKSLLELKKKQQKIIALTAYGAEFASIIDEMVNIILVGDSMANVIYGKKTTLDLTLATVIEHAKAVVKTTNKALVVVDMPFATYQVSPQIAFKNAARIIQKTGCDAVKIEGGKEMAETIQFLQERGIAVMAHIGLKPQHYNTSGGYSYQGKNPDNIKMILEDAKAIQNAGAFATVLELITPEATKIICDTLDIITIGIGASSQCDGQIRVLHDIIGLTQNTPSFVKKYADVTKITKTAVQEFVTDVINGKI